MPQAFIPYTISGIRDRAILVRTSINPLSMIKGISQEIWAVDHNIALAQTGSLESFLYRFSYARPEFGLKTLGAFAGIGLLLVVIGIFSVMAYTVSLQTHEIGIRLALGARQSSILTMILTKGMRLMAAGVLIGSVPTIALSPLAATRMSLPASVVNKRLTAWLSPLDAILTKNRGAHPSSQKLFSLLHSLDVPSLPIRQRQHASPCYHRRCCLRFSQEKASQE
jgi:ABC-type antimicrobial peptide transport system permease subunit